MVVARIIAGWSLLAVGSAMLVLPGPGIAVMLVGLGLLAQHQAWAARARDWLLARARAAAARVTGPRLP